MYKDKDKQKEANRKASQRRRNKLKGLTVGEMKTGVVIPERTVPVIPNRGKDIKCFADLPPDVQKTIEKMSKLDSVYSEGKRKRTAAAIKYQHLFPDSYEPGASDADFTRRLAQADQYAPLQRVSKPSDTDYDGICTEGWRAERGR